MREAVAYLKIYDINDYPALQTINRKEIMRYAGMFRNGKTGEINDEMLNGMLDVMEETIAEVMPLLTYKVSYRADELSWDGDAPITAFDSMKSQDLAQNLQGCDEYVMFAATIGIGIDRLIAKYNHISPVKALFLQAIGAERIEALCDLFNDEIISEASSRGKVTNRRYSPGYGDFPLAVQKEFMTLLDCSRRIGVNLNESLLMSPSKSVTAVIGIGNCDSTDKRQNDENESADDTLAKHNCSECNKTDCEFRKTVSESN